MNTAILCSGGDCAGMNPALKHYVEATIERGGTPHFIHRGFEGLIDRDIRAVGYSDVSGIIDRGGTVIQSARSTRFRDPAERAIAAANLRALGIRGLAVLGGDGSYQGLKLLCEEHDVHGIGIPATIDNDIAGTDYCLGVDTALNAIGHCLDQIRDTAASFRRAFVVETMGRDSGYLALVSAVNSGAEVCLVPEIAYDLDSIASRMAQEFVNGRSYAIAVVSEATGASDELLELFRNKVGIESRLTVLGHIQRGGSPTAVDRRVAFEFAEAAVCGLESDLTAGASALCYHGARVVESPVGCTSSSLPGSLLRAAQRLAS